MEVDVPDHSLARGHGVLQARNIVGPPRNSSYLVGFGRRAFSPAFASNPGSLAMLLAMHLASSSVNVFTI